MRNNGIAFSREGANLAIYFMQAVKNAGQSNVKYTCHYKNILNYFLSWSKPLVGLLFCLDSFSLDRSLAGNLRLHQRSRERNNKSKGHDRGLFRADCGFVWETDESDGWVSMTSKFKGACGNWSYQTWKMLGYPDGTNESYGWNLDGELESNHVSNIMISWYNVIQIYYTVSWQLEKLR